MSELKPCPFCGGEAETKASRYEPIELTLWAVRCKTPWCVASSSLVMYATEAEAIEAWNTRAERTCRVIGSYYDDLIEEDYTDLSCGHHVRGAEWEFSFCPDCGAKVMEANDD